MLDMIRFPRLGGVSHYFVLIQIFDGPKLEHLEPFANSIVREFNKRMIGREYTDLVTIDTGSGYRVETSPIGQLYLKVMLVDASGLPEEEVRSMLHSLLLRTDAYIERLYFGKGDSRDAQRFLNDNWNGFLNAPHPAFS